MSSLGSDVSGDGETATSKSISFEADDSHSDSAWYLWASCAPVSLGGHMWVEVNEWSVC